MGRGGYQLPQGAQPASGPGKFSRRTDAQKIAVPTSTGAPEDLQSGDAQRLEAAQRVAPIPKAQIGPRQSGNVGPRQGPEALPPDMPSQRPGEPVTAGMDMGPGPGSEILNTPPAAPDLRTQVMQYWQRNFGNQQAADAVAQIQQPQPAQGMPPGAPSPDLPLEPFQ